MVSAETSCGHPGKARSWQWQQLTATTIRSKRGFGEEPEKAQHPMPKYKEALKSIGKLKRTWRKKTKWRWAAYFLATIWTWSIGWLKSKKPRTLSAKNVESKAKQRNTSSTTLLESTLLQPNHHLWTRWRKTPHLPYASGRRGSLRPTARLCPNPNRYDNNPSTSLFNNNINHQQ